MKRILHFADIHFHQSTLDDLKAPCAKIVEYARSLADTDDGLDAIVVAGDLTTDRGIIDNATAVAARSFINRLAKWAPVYIVAGNHDLTFREGQPNNLRAILADDTGSILSHVYVIDSPEIVVRDGYSLSFLPYPSPATFHAVTGESDLGELSSRLVEVARGLAVQAKEYGGCPLAVFHGTVEGGRHGDESSPALTTRGRDVQLSTNALAGFRGTLCGHLHHPQDIQTPDGIAKYPGCVAPLTFGERNIEPGVLIWEVDGAEVVGVERHPLPVSHQRVQVEIGPEQWDEGADAKLNLLAWIQWVATEGGRVKVKLTLGRQRLQLFTPEIIESVREGLTLDQLKVDKTEIPEGREWFQQGVDRAAKVDVVEALEAYADYCGDPAYREHLDSIVAIGREVEELIDHLSEDPRYEFEPVRLELSNYKQFADATVNFAELPARSGILGATGIGKSNLVLGIAAALFGGNPKSENGKAKTTIGDMVRRGEKDARIRLVFRSGDGLFRITRTITVDGKGRGTSKLFFEQGYRENGGPEETWVAINEGTATETQKEIEKRVGPESLHWLTRHLRQHGQSAVKMGSTELADAMNSTLQLDFEARQQHAKQIVATAESAKQAANNRRGVLEGQLVPEELLDEQEAAAKAKLDAAASKGRQQQAQADDLEVHVHEKSGALAVAQAKAQQIAKAAARKAELVHEIDVQRGKKDRALRELASFEGAADLVELEAAASQARVLADQATDRLQEVTSAFHRAEREAAGALGALAQSAQAAALHRQTMQARLSAAERRVDELGRSAALVKQVPCRGDRWVDPVEGEMDGASCLLLSAARKSMDDLPAAVEAANSARKAYDDSEADLAVARKEHEDCQNSVALESMEAQGDVNTAAETLRMARDLVAKCEKNLADNRARAERVRELKQSTEQIDALLSNYSRELAEVGADAAAAVTLAGEVKVLEGQLAEMKARLLSLRQAAQINREAAVRAESELEQIERMRQVRKDTLGAIHDLTREAEHQERRRLSAAYYLEAVQRTGIPSLLLEQLAPQLENRINDMLEPIGRRVRIDTTRELTTGKTKTEVTLSFQSPSSGNEFVPIAELSGGEEDTLNLAFAAGLARVAADMTGVPLGAIYLDEPLVGVSESLQTEALEVMGRIGNHARKLIVITHRRDLASGMDAVLEVNANGCGSTVLLK